MTKWIEKTEWLSNGSFGAVYHICPECGAVIGGKANSCESYKDNFCPNCGADMRDEFKEEQT